MKQRIRVTAICKKDGDILLLKRAGGRMDGAEIDFELPTGKIIFGEQPEEAMARVLYALAPDGARKVMEQIERYGIIIIYILLLISGTLLTKYLVAGRTAIIDAFYWIVGVR